MSDSGSISSLSPDSDLLVTMEDHNGPTHSAVGEVAQNNGPTPDAGVGNTNGTNDTRVDRTDLGSVISQSTKNNYSKVYGLIHFNGGEDKDPDKPNAVCELRGRNWIQNIDARATEALDDAGRIQVAKQHASRMVVECITTAVSRHGVNWSKVKEHILETYPEWITYSEKKAQVTNARRKTSETIPD